MIQTISAPVNAKSLFMLTIVLLVMMHVLCDANTQPELFQRHTRKRLCGRALSETLSNICALYNPMEKKSGKRKIIFFFYIALTLLISQEKT